MASKEPPREVAQIRAAIRDFFKTETSDGRRIGSAKAGVYAFYDYDGEPIYVGQTIEGLSGRVSRHLTGRRSDAVAKFVLDPFEVLEIEVYPVFDLTGTSAEKHAVIDPLEYTVYEQARTASRFGAVLNEGAIKPTPLVPLPQSYRGRIIPDELFEDRAHPDIRIARRAQTVASLARLISERKVKPRFRQVLHTQTARLDWLSDARLRDFADEPLDAEDEETD